MAKTQIAAILALVCFNTIINQVNSNLHGPFFRAAVACPGTSQTNAPWANRSSRISSSCGSAWSGADLRGAECADPLHATLEHYGHR